MNTIVSYSDLPELGELGVRHAWNVWPANDRRGTLNRVTDETVRAALATVQTGERISLSLPLGYLDPPLYGRIQVGHRIFDRNRNMVEDEITTLDPQGSSQWDSLRHIRAGKFGHYGGLAPDDPAVDELGIDGFATLGLVLRGALIDLPAYWAATGIEVDPFSPHVVTVAHLRAAAEHQGLRWQPGDLLLVRTGWIAGYRERNGVPADQLEMPNSVGLDASAEMAAFLWDEGFCAVATDNPAVEFLPSDPAVGSLHRRLIPALGMPLGELWDLDELAERAAPTRRYEMCIVSVPLRVPGGVASPANAMAIL